MCVAFVNCIALRFVYVRVCLFVCVHVHIHEHAQKHALAHTVHENLCLVKGFRQ